MSNVKNASFPLTPLEQVKKMLQFVTDTTNQLTHEWEAPINKDFYGTHFYTVSFTDLPEVFPNGNPSVNDMALLIAIARVTHNAILFNINDLAVGVYILK